MKIRRFYSKNMRGALRQVADVFGPEAAILSNKKVPGGVEVIAALDYDESLLPAGEAGNKNPDFDESFSSAHAEEQHPQASGQPKAPQPTTNQPAAGHGEHHSAQGHGVMDAADGLAADRVELSTHFGAGQSDQQPAGLKAHLSQPETRETSSPQASKAEAWNGGVAFRGENAHPASQIEWGVDPGLLAMKEELGLMRSMIAEQLRVIGWSRFGEQNPLQAMLIRRLSQLGIAPQLHAALLSDFQPAEDAECSWQALLARLAKKLPVADKDILQSGGVFALMGPAGVGKTTTIAKLAARHIIKHGSDSVGLITTDNYRVSAQEQLSAFGRLLKVPVARVSKAHNLQQRLKQFADKRLVLIDTAGMSVNDNALSQPLKDICNSDTKITPVLLLSAASQLASMQRVLDLFRPYQPKGLILTKLDEAASLGECLSLLLQNPLPVIYTCDGQKIPEDIRLARSHHLVAKAVWLSNKYAQTVDDWLLAQASTGPDGLAKSA